MHGSVIPSVKQFVNGMAHTNGIEGVWAALKHGHNGTYQNWTRKHCHRYVDEFALRLNGGSCEVDATDRLEDLFRSMASRCSTRG